MSGGFDRRHGANGKSANITKESKMDARKVTNIEALLKAARLLALAGAIACLLAIDKAQAQSVYYSGSVLEVYGTSGVDKIEFVVNSGLVDVYILDEEWQVVVYESEVASADEITDIDVHLYTDVDLIYAVEVVEENFPILEGFYVARGDAGDYINFTPWDGVEFIIF
jgi:hypothetical protein